MADDYGYTVNNVVDTINLGVLLDSENTDSILSVGIVAYPEFFTDKWFPKLVDIIVDQCLSKNDYDDDRVIVVRSNNKLHGLPVRSNPVYSAELLLCHTPLCSVEECNTIYDCISVGNASVFGMTYSTFIDIVQGEKDGCKLESACDLWLFVNELGLIDVVKSSPLYV